MGRKRSTVTIDLPGVGVFQAAIAEVDRRLRGEIGLRVARQTAEAFQDDLADIKFWRSLPDWVVAVVHASIYGSDW